MYDHTMKKNVLYAQLTSTPYGNEKTKKRFTHLKLPGLPLKPPVPDVAKVPCPEYKYFERSVKLGTYSLT
jgi:hypothetical protein